MLLYSFPETHLSLMCLPLILMRRRRHLIQRASSSVQLIVVALLTSNTSIISNPDYDKNNSHDPYHIPGENDGSIYMEKSTVSYISYYRPEYDQERECDRQPSAFIYQPVRKFFRYFSS